jgi:hypothetical protein
MPYRQNPRCQCGPQCQRQPIIQFGAAGRVFLKFDAEANLGDIYDADIKLVEWLPVEKTVTLGSGSGFGFRPSDRYWYPATTPSKHNIPHIAEAHARRG